MSVTVKTFVIGIETNVGFFLNNLILLLPILPIAVNKKLKKDEKIPYFGHENCIVSIIPNKEIEKYVKGRGIRYKKDSKEEPSTIKNTIALDFQTFLKNIYIKIFSSKNNKSDLHVTGARNVEMAIDICNRLIKYINDTNDLWLPFFSINIQQRIELVNEIIGRLCIENCKFINNYEILKKKLKDNISTSEKFSFFENQIDFILRLATEFDDYNQYYDYLIKLCNVIGGFNSLFHNQENIKIIKYEIYNCTYNSNIKIGGIMLGPLANILVNRGYNAGFQNLGKICVIISIPIQDEFQNYISDGKNKYKAHSFKLKENGDIELTSKAEQEESYKAMDFIKNLLVDIINSEEYKSNSGIDINNIELTDNLSQHYFNVLSQIGVPIPQYYHNNNLLAAQIGFDTNDYEF